MTITFFWKSKWIRVVLVVLFFILLIVGVAYGSGWYPIMTVNGSVVWARDERISYRLAQNFYRTMEEQAHIQAPQDDQLINVVYDGLVDNVLIRDELRAMLSDDELQEKITTRVQGIIGDAQGLQQAMEFTQVSEKDTRKYFLEPLARQQLLGELLSVKRNQDIGSWLLRARASAHVVAWFMKGTWNGEGGYENK